MRTPFKSGFLLTATSATILIAHAGESAAQSYSVTDLGTGAANAINDAGQIVGTANARAVLWDGSTETVLSAVGHYDTATAINSAGQVAGFDDIGSPRPDYQPLTWNGTGAAGLSGGADTSGIATGINNSGEQVGVQFQIGHRGQLQGVVWNGSQVITLGSLASNTYSRATGINDNGQEVGYFFQDNHSGMRQAVLWNGATPTLLGTLGSGTSSDAIALNDNGQEVGYSDAPGYLHRSAVLWNGTTPTALGTLGGTNSMALAVNNSGEAVGYSYLAGNTNKQAVLWENGKVINLNSELTPAEIAAGWVLQSATGINNNGVIVGDAVNNLTGKDFAFELNVVAAVPEPKSIETLLAGLGIVGFIAGRRNKNSQPLRNYV